MNRAKAFFSNLTGQKVSETSEIKEEMGDFNLDVLHEFTYPVSRNEMLETLRANGSSGLLINAIEKIDRDMFNDLNDVRSRLNL